MAIIATLNIFPLKGGKENHSKPLDYLNNRQNYLDELAKYLSSINFGGCDLDIIPEGYGEFGYNVTNPIPIGSELGNMIYFRKLRTMSGKKVQYKRLGSSEAPNIKYKIDNYEISVENEKITNLFVCPYYRTNSSRTPKGFKLI